MTDIGTGGYQTASFHTQSVAAPTLSFAGGALSTNNGQVHNCAMPIFSGYAAPIAAPSYPNYPIQGSGIAECNQFLQQQSHQISQATRPSFQQLHLPGYSQQSSTSTTSSIQTSSADVVRCFAQALTQAGVNSSQYEQLMTSMATASDANAALQLLSQYTQTLQASNPSWANFFSGVLDKLPAMVMQTRQQAVPMPPAQRNVQPSFVHARQSVGFSPGSASVATTHTSHSLTSWFGAQSAAKRLVNGSRSNILSQMQAAHTPQAALQTLYNWLTNVQATHDRLAIDNREDLTPQLLALHHQLSTMLSSGVPMASSTPISNPPVYAQQSGQPTYQQQPAQQSYNQQVYQQPAYQQQISAYQQPAQATYQQPAYAQQPAQQSYSQPPAQPAYTQTAAQPFVQPSFTQSTSTAAQTTASIQTHAGDNKPIQAPRATGQGATLGLGSKPTYPHLLPGSGYYAGPPTPLVGTRTSPTTTQVPLSNGIQLTLNSNVNGIFDENVQVVVNAAQQALGPYMGNNLQGIQGLNRAMYEKRGDDYRQAYDRFHDDCRCDESGGGFPMGAAALLPGGVMIAAGPDMRGKNSYTAEDQNNLYRCYYNSLALAASQGVSSIAFPAISTAIYTFDKKLAADIAIRAAQDFAQAQGHGCSLKKIVFLQASQGSAVSTNG